MAAGLSLCSQGARGGRLTFPPFCRYERRNTVSLEPNAMKPQYWILVAVSAGLLAWAGLETQRLCVAKKQLAASLELNRVTSQRAEFVHLKLAQAKADHK